MIFGDLVSYNDAFHSICNEMETFKLFVSIPPLPQSSMLNHNREVSSVKVDYFICCLNWMRSGGEEGREGTRGKFYGDLDLVFFGLLSS